MSEDTPTLLSFGSEETWSQFNSVMLKAPPALWVCRNIGPFANLYVIRQETTAEVVDLSTRKHQDWFDEANKEIQELLEKKRSGHSHLLAKPNDQAAEAAYKTACSTLQAKLRTMQNDLWAGLDERKQRYADMGDMGDMGDMRAF